MSWSVGLRNLYVSHRYPDLNRLMDDNYRVEVAAFLLVWASAFVIYLFVSVLERFSFTRIPLCTFAGVVAFVGFPLICLYSKRDPLLVGELVVAGICVAIWAKGKWPVSKPLNILLFLIHFIFWSTFGGGYLLAGGQYLLWPGWYWTRDVWKHAWVSYPALGFALSLLWASCCVPQQLPRATTL